MKDHWEMLHIIVQIGLGKTVQILLKGRTYSTIKFLKNQQESKGHNIGLGKEKTMKQFFLNYGYINLCSN